MPIYEYRCQDCGTRFSLFFLPPERPEPRCTRCGSVQARRVPSRFATVRSEEDRMESLAGGTALGDVNESDPRSMARWMRRMGREMGEDLGDEFDEAVDEMEAGAGGEGPAEE